MLKGGAGPFQSSIYTLQKQQMLAHEDDGHTGPYSGPPSLSTVAREQKGDVYRRLSGYDMPASRFRGKRWVDTKARQSHSGQRDDDLVAPLWIQQQLEPYEESSGILLGLHTADALYWWATPTHVRAARLPRILAV